MRALTQNVYGQSKRLYGGRNEESPIEGINMKNCSLTTVLEKRQVIILPFFVCAPRARSNGCNPRCAQATTKYLSLCFGRAGDVAELMEDLEGVKRYYEKSLVIREEQWGKTGMPQEHRDLAICYHAGPSVPKTIDEWLELLTQAGSLPLSLMMHTRAERKMLPFSGPARGAEARSASLQQSGPYSDMWTEKFNDGVKYRRNTAEAGF